MTKAIGFGWVAVLLGVVACGSGGASGGSAASLTAYCAGEYTCEAPGVEAFTTTLSRHEDTCYAGQAALGDDGLVYFEDGSIATWTGDARRFQICIDGDCLTCQGDAAPAPSPESSGQCTGYPTSCSSRSPGSCAVQEGCSMQFRVRWNGELEPYCGGSADSCSSFDSQFECEDQSGCSWE